VVNTFLAYLIALAYAEISNIIVQYQKLHSYEIDGTFSVSLTARSASGSDTILRTDYIPVPEPGA